MALKCCQNVDSVLVKQPSCVSFIEKQQPGVRDRLCHFFSESSLHGVKYLGIQHLHKIERIFWICAVLASFGFSIFLVHQVYRKFLDNPIIISFQPTETHVSRLIFPAITICDLNRLKQSVFREMIRQYNETLIKLMEERQTGNISNSTVEEFQTNEFVCENAAQYCLAAPTFKRALNETIINSKGESDLFGAIQEELILGGLDNFVGIVDATNASDHAWWKMNDFFQRSITNCSDLIVKCRLAQNFIPCVEVFRYVRTVSGWCCTFNMMPPEILRNVEADANERQEILKVWERFKMEDLILSEDESAYYDENTREPFRQKAGGMQFGMTLLLNPNVNEYSTCNTNDGWGFKITTHSPLSFPSVSDYGVLIPINSEVFMEVDPQVTTADIDDLGSFDVKKRGCYFPNDAKAQLQKYNFYSAENCIDECIAKFTFQNCSCLHHYMPGNTDMLCSAKQQKCTDDVRTTLLTHGTARGKCSHCLPTCTNIKYTPRLSYVPLRDGGNGGGHVYEDLDNNKKTALNYSILHIFIGSDSIHVKERKRLFNGWDLLANTGGLLGLAFGFSIISILEIIYFFTIRPCFYKETPENNDGDDSQNGNMSSSTASRRKSLTSKLLVTRHTQLGEIQPFSA